jgi:hypothetical protein
VATKTSPKTKGKNWIAGAISRPGALRAKLRVPEGKNIPAKKLAVKESDSPTTKRQKNLAKTLGRLRK